MTATSRPTLSVDQIEKALRARYVFTDRIPAISAALKTKAATGRYARATDASDLANRLTEDMIAVSNDLHFAVRHDPATASALQKSDKPVPSATDDNHGFTAVQMLPSGLGYLRLDHFGDPESGYAAAVGAMAILAPAKGLILDLRYNRGGVLEMAQLLLSHLFPGDGDRLLFHYYYNEDGRRVERGQWVLPAIPGPRKPDMPVAVLIGSTSFSAGEWTAFTLKQLQRATVFGERSAGGAHPVTTVALDDQFVLQVPIGEIQGPKGGDFEGKGVVPDVVVPAHRALAAARLHLLMTMVDQYPSAAWHLPVARAALELTEAKRVLERNRAKGRYEGRDVVLEGDSLIYRWRGRFTAKLEPLGHGLFAVEGADFYRLRLVEENDAVVALERVFRNGERIRHARLD